MAKQELIDLLDTNKNVAVGFETKVGGERIMNCTRNLSFIPVKQHEGINNPVLNAVSIICVYDLLIKDWRAFRWDKVFSVDVVSEIVPEAISNEM